jgi:hypothetical protein
MARFHGRSGALYVDVAGTGAAPSPVANTAKWTIDRTTDKVEDTALGDSNKQYLSGLPDGKGTFSGFLDDSAQQLYLAASDGVARKFYLYARVPDVYWYGTALFDMSAAGGVAEAVTISGNWTAASTITKVPA